MKNKVAKTEVASWAAPCGRGLDRRAFLSKSALCAAAVALAACGGIGDLTSPSSIDSTINVSDHPELANVGGVAMFSVSGTPIAIVRTEASTFIALSRICPHQGSTVGSNGNGFTCPNHGAMFSRTGSWVGGQPTTNMRSYAVTFDATANTLRIS